MKEKAVPKVPWPQASHMELSRGGAPGPLSHQPSLPEEDMFPSPAVRQGGQPRLSGEIPPLPPRPMPLWAGLEWDHTVIKIVEFPQAAGEATGLSFQPAFFGRELRRANHIYQHLAFDEGAIKRWCSLFLLQGPQPH